MFSYLTLKTRIIQLTLGIDACRLYPASQGEVK